MSFSFATPITPNWSVSEWSGFNLSNPIGTTVAQGTRPEYGDHGSIADPSVGWVSRSYVRRRRVTTVTHG
ncbi:MAG TPA: hypothetical protein VGY99_16805 [Candidatus Binataceae bacterium]|nr:hypothetical protein [Candidatus Binataceae bacterium]